MTWVAAYAADVPARTWGEGSHSYYYRDSYTDPEAWEETTKTHGFETALGGFLYDGFVLLRPGSVRSAVDGGESGGCPALDPAILDPTQPARFVWGGVTPSDMTYEEAVDHFSTATANVYWDGAMEPTVELVLDEILEWTGVDPWMSYVCSTYASP